MRPWSEFQIATHFQLKLIAGLKWATRPFAFKSLRRSSPYGDVTSTGSHAGFGQFKPTLERCEVRLALSAIPFLPFDVDLLGGDEFQPNEPLVSKHFSVDHTVQDNTDELHPMSLPQIAAWSAGSSSSMGSAVGAQSAAAIYGLEGRGQTVAIIDSGIAYDHHALGRGYGENFKVVGGWDFAENDNNPYDDAPGGYHGTHVAGIIGSEMVGRLGVAPAVDFVALRVFDDFGKSDIAWTEAALKWVYDHRDSFENPITTVNLSLGASWNSVTPPSWASLEEELSDLNRAGIVVVVSAGNSFQQHLEPGLAYPAASPFTIPVGSLDDDGLLSDFSQRDSRILAAPGRNIESAVPDFFFGKDGIINDWAKSSGTSMATPFVSGAAVLVREAFELVGDESVTPDRIYNTLRESAGQVFDSVTNQYYNTLDIHSAIESVLPKDNVPDSWGNAVVSEARSQWRVDGWINSLGDQDVYRYRASQAGDVSLRFDSQVISLESWTLIKNGIPIEKDQLASDPSQAHEMRFRVNSGDEFGFVVSESQRVGSFSVSGELIPVVGLQNAAHGESNVPIYGSMNQAHAVEQSVNASFVKQVDDTLFVHGSASANQFKLDLSRGVRIEMDGETHFAESASVKRVVIDGVQNKDSISIIGSAASEKVEMRVGETRVSNEFVELVVSNVEQIRFDGGGGADRVYLYDAETDDRLESYPNRANLRGVGYDFVVENSARIFVHATQGGDDQAFVYDSPGDDVLTVRPQFASLSGDGYFNYLAGFERVYAYGNHGGLDSASIYDSVGNDLFSSSGAVTSIVGEGFSTFVRGFEQVEAYSQSGGFDQAKIYVGSGQNVHQSSDYVSAYGISQYSTARYFERVEIQESNVSPPVATASLPSQAEDPLESLALLMLEQSALDPEVRFP